MCEDKTPAGAPEAAIEITPEMIEAGADVLRESAEIYSSLRGVEDLLAEKILKAGLEVASAGRA